MLGTDRLGTRPCEREADVLAAAAAGRTASDLDAHVASCQRCREALAVSGWMRDMSDTSGLRVTLPDPGTLWWKAQMVRRWDAERRSTAPVESMERAELIAALVAIVLGAIWGLPALWQSIAGATDVSTGTMARLALSTDPARLATYVWMALTAVAVGTFYLLHRTLFSEY